MERNGQFSDDEAKLIAKEFDGDLKKLSKALSKIAEAGIAHESSFYPKTGKLVVRLIKEETKEEFQNRPRVKERTLRGFCSSLLNVDYCRDSYS